MCIVQIENRAYFHCNLIQENMEWLKDEIREKKRQMRVLEQRMIGSVETSPYGSSVVEMSQVSLSII